ncbi:MAG: holo-ACP synthase [Candidatus Eisenbacteria bacterium]|nr:holo-ACP synthase [Candidatus Eisenbacteria bacterium]
MIAGIGMDMVLIERMRRAIDRFGDRFLRRVFTEGEIAYCRTKRDPVPSFAARFAAKEAAMKALGTGVSRGVFFRHVEVSRRRGEGPRVLFHGGARRRADLLDVAASHLTLTHEKNIAAAFVVLMKKPSRER